MRGVQIIQGSRGPLEVPEDAFIETPWGIPGFRDEKSWVVAALKSGHPVMRLQSTTTPSRVLPVVIPWVFNNSYELKIPESALIELGIYSRSEVEVLSVMTMAKGNYRSTVNLFAPIVINKTSMVAMQVTNQIEGYSTRDPLLGPEPVNQIGWKFPCALVA